MEEKRSVSFILPVYNETDLIESSIAHFSHFQSKEIIVVDGGSTDGTYEKLQRIEGVKLLKAKMPHRAKQMNLGASEARGDILCFVHTDTLLPKEGVSFFEKIEEKDFYGGFFKKYSPSSYLMRFYSWCLNHLYLKWGRGLVGSNAIFMTSNLFSQVGGFPEEDFMEDVLISSKLKRIAKMVVIKEPITVSARRYEKSGKLSQIFKNAWIMFQYFFLKKKPSDLKGAYE